MRATAVNSKLLPQSNCLFFDLRNSIPIGEVEANVDPYEITPAYRYIWEDDLKKVRVIEEPWAVKDDEGILSYSLLPAAVAVSLIKQTASVLGL